MYKNTESKINIFSGLDGLTYMETIHICIDTFFSYFKLINTIILTLERYVFGTHIQNELRAEEYIDRSRSYKVTHMICALYAYQYKDTLNYRPF
jgi:hypothetical protein